MIRYKQKINIIEKTNVYSKFLISYRTERSGGYDVGKGPVKC